MTARVDLLGVCKQIILIQQFFWFLGTFHGKSLTFSLFKNPFNVWNYKIIALLNCLIVSYSLESNNSDEKMKFCYFSILLQVLNWWRLWFFGRHFPKYMGTNILFDIHLILDTIALHHCKESQKTHQNSFGVLDPNLPLVRQSNMVFFKIGTVFLYGPFLAND